MRKVLVAVAIALVTASCAAQDAPDPTPNLLREYVHSTDVKNDRFAGVGSSEDRIANFAAFYSVDRLNSRLLSAFECTTAGDPSQWGADHFDTSCDLTDQVLAGVGEAGGTPEKVNGRVIVVKHDDGSLELLTVFVVNNRLVDGNGDTYADLTDFRENNGVLTAADIITAPDDITAVPGEGKIVTLYGHTPSHLGLSLLVVAGGVVLLVVVLVMRRRRAPRPAAADEATETRPL